MIIITKNSTGSNIYIDDLYGQEILASGQVTLSLLYTFAEISNSLNLKTLIEAGTIIINDGISDLNINDGVEHVSEISQYKSVKKLQDLENVPIPESNYPTEILGSDGTAFIWVNHASNNEYYYYVNDDSVSSTTSPVYKQKLRLTTDVIPAGIYRIGYSFLWTGENNNHKYQFRIQINDTTDILNVVRTPGLSYPKQSDVWNLISSFINITLTNSSHFIDIDFKNNNNKTTYIKESSIEFWGVN